MLAAWRLCTAFDSACRLGGNLMVFADEVTELRRLVHPGDGVAGTFLRVLGFSVLSFLMGFLVQDHPDAAIHVFGAVYGTLALYLAVWLAFEFPSVYRLLLFPFGLLARRGKPVHVSAGVQDTKGVADPALRDPRRISALLTHSIPLSQARLRQYVRTRSNVDVVARSPASHLASAASGLAVAAVLFVAGSAPLLFMPESFWVPWLCVMALGPAFVPMVKGLAAVRQQERRRRQARVARLQPDVDAMAARIAGVVEASHLAGAVPPEGFALYLRPFGSTGRVRVNIHRLYEAVEVDFEMLFACALRPYVQVVALGQPGEQVGAGRVATTDDAWQALAGALIDRATCIYVIPSARPGTLWELQVLQRTRAMDRCVFIMPPQGRMSDDGRPFSKHWAAAARACEAFGLRLPPYRTEGLLFTLSEDGHHVAQSAPVQVLVTRPGFTPMPGRDLEADAEGLVDLYGLDETRDDRLGVPAWVGAVFGVATVAAYAEASGAAPEATGGGGGGGGDMDIGGGGD